MFSPRPPAILGLFVGVMIMAPLAAHAQAQSREPTSPSLPAKAAARNAPITPSPDLSGAASAERDLAGGKKMPRTGLVEKKEAAMPGTTLPTGTAPAPNAASAPRGSPNMPGGVGTGSKRREGHNPRVDSGGKT